MTITREQVADLQPGDVVEFRLDEWDSGQAIRGPLATSDAYPDVLEVRIPGGDGRYWVRAANRHPFDGEHRTLTVISRAPRLYVNHPRTEPVVGDVVRDAQGADGRTWCADEGGPLCWERLDDGDHGFYHRNELPARLRLLVDGETGQVVP